MLSKFHFFSTQFLSPAAILFNHGPHFHWIKSDGILRSESLCFQVCSPASLGSSPLCVIHCSYLGRRQTSGLEPTKLVWNAGLLMSPWKPAALVSAALLSRHRDQVEKWDNGSGVKQHWVNSCVFVNSCQVFEGFSGPAERGVSDECGWLEERILFCCFTVSRQDVQARWPLIVCVRQNKGWDWAQLFLKRILHAKRLTKGIELVEYVINKTSYHFVFSGLDSSTFPRHDRGETLFFFFWKPPNGTCSFYWPLEWQAWALKRDDWSQGWIYSSSHLLHLFFGTHAQNRCVSLELK